MKVADPQELASRDSGPPMEGNVAGTPEDLPASHYTTYDGHACQALLAQRDGRLERILVGAE